MGLSIPMADEAGKEPQEIQKNRKSDREENDRDGTEGMMDGDPRREGGKTRRWKEKRWKMGDRRGMEEREDKLTGEIQMG